MKQLKNLVRIAAKYRVPQYIMSRVINVFIRINPQLRQLSNAQEAYHEYKLPCTISDSTAHLLDEIPSETSSQERRFLYWLFSSIWSGENNVVEIGPFLGGTTRAIALGMQSNSRASMASKLYTFDRFCGYYDITKLKEYLEPLINSKVLQESDLDSVNDSASFSDIFTKIHSNHGYFKQIAMVNLGVPDRPEDLQNTKNEYFKIQDNILVDAVFVDGCKSWFGTKYFMSEVSKNTRAGCIFIF